MNPARRLPWCYLHVKLANSGGSQRVTTAMRLTGALGSPVGPLQSPTVLFYRYIYVTTG